MARVTRHSAQGQIPVQQAQLIDPSGFRADTSSAEALKVAGKAVGDFAIKLEEERKIKEELAKRKRASQDRIGITNVNAIMDDAEREYTKQIIGKPLTEHEAIRTKITANARARANQADLSPEAREIAKANTDIRMEKFADEAELANIVATNNDALIKTSEAYETALVESDIDTIAEAEGLLDAELENMEPAEAAKYKADLEERATKEMGTKALQNMMDKAALVPANTVEIMEDELNERKKGKTSMKIGSSAGDVALLSDTQLVAVKNYAKGVITSNKNKIQEQYDIASGEVVKGWSEGIRTGDITEQDIWDTVIEVSPDKETDAAALKSQWATIVRGLETRKRTTQEGTDKKNREDAYDPKLSASLKTEARKAESRKQIQDIKLRSAQALEKNFIDDADMETISVSADKAFDTVVDSTVDSHDSDLKGIMLKGTSSESLAPWLQAQAIAFKATGRTMTSPDINELIQTFADVGKAKTWGSDEARREVEAEIARTDKEITVDGVRLLYLQAQKRWLRKNDTELVKEYREWLQKKP